MYRRDFYFLAPRTSNNVQTRTWLLTSKDNFMLSKEYSQNDLTYAFRNCQTCTSTISCAIHTVR